MKKQKVMKTVIVLLIILLIPQAIMARGGMDQELKYEEELQEATEQICTALETKEMTAAQAKSLLSELRLRFRKEYTDESGRMDAIIDALANGEMTSEQARQGFMVMQQDRIAERERAQQQQQQLQEKQSEAQQQKQNQSDNDPDKTQEKTQNEKRDQDSDQEKDSKKSK